MPNILILNAAEPSQNCDRISSHLRAAGHCVAAMHRDTTSNELAAQIGSAFHGKPPDIVVADQTGAIGCLGLHYLRRTMRTLWSDERTGPIVLALLEQDHLFTHEWTTLVDDFLLPPYDIQEIVARIKLMLFRRRHILSGNRISLPCLNIDLDTGRASGPGDQLIDLTPKEFQLLLFLASHKGKFFTRDRLIDFVWGVNFEGGERTVDIHIRRLRAKLPTVTGELLETQRGIGYGFRTE